MKFAATIGLVLILHSFVSAQRIYKWKDETGQWHFSNTPSEVGSDASTSDSGASQLVEKLYRCELKAKPGDASGSYFDEQSGKNTIISLPASQDVFAQFLQTYILALCNRLHRGEVTRERFESLVNAMVIGVQDEKRKVLAELTRLEAEEKERLELERERQTLEREKAAVERERLALNQERQTLHRQKQDLQRQQLITRLEAMEAQRRAAEVQQQTAQAVNNAMAIQRQAWQNYWESWSHRFQSGMRNPIQCRGLNLGMGIFTVNCD